MEKRGDASAAAELYPTLPATGGGNGVTRDAGGRRRRYDRYDR